MANRKTVSAHTSFPNTPESDRQPRVMHDVTVEVTPGTRETVRLLATDPGDALDRVRDMPAAQYAALPRVKERA